jgi:hypothetical protein
MSALEIIFMTKVNAQLPQMPRIEGAITGLITETVCKITFLS